MIYQQVNGDNMKKAVIFDIDGTLADSEYRLAYIEQKPKLWDKFYSESLNDKYIPDVYNQYLYHKKQGNSIIILTGRSENSRAITEEWLLRKNIIYDKLFLCPNSKTGMPQHLVKEEIIISLKNDFKIIAGYDDNENMRGVYKNLDIKFYFVKNKKIEG